MKALSVVCALALTLSPLLMKTVLAAEVNCPEAWNKMIDLAKVGDFDTYRTLTTMTSPQFSYQSTTTIKTTYEEVSADHLTSKIETTVDSNPYPVQAFTLNRDQFIKNCEHPQSSPDMVIIAQGNEQVSVPAGNFNCTFTKFRLNSNNTITEVMNDMTQLPTGYSLRVKSTSETTMPGNMKNTSVTELIDYRH